MDLPCWVHIPEIAGSTPATASIQLRLYMKYFYLVILLLLVGCTNYNRVYFRTMDEVIEAFPDFNQNETIKVKQITEQTHEYYNQYMVKYAI
jgi:hypothetical protein